jgi:hypothetical protein
MRQLSLDVANKDLMRYIQRIPLEQFSRRDVGIRPSTLTNSRRLSIEDTDN